MTRAREKREKEKEKREDSSLYRRCSAVTNRRRKESEWLDEMDGCSGVFLVTRENDTRVVCVSPLHLLAVDTMMRQIVRERDLK